jgi:hypothetical protein
MIITMCILKNIIINKVLVEEGGAYVVGKELDLLLGEFKVISSSML